MLCFCNPAFALCSAPGKSLSLISYEKYHQLQGQRDDRGSLDAEGKSTGEPKTNVEPKKGEDDLILLDYLFLLKMGSLGFLCLDLHFSFLSRKDGFTI
jgi:hypothetical protein